MTKRERELDQLNETISRHLKIIHKCSIETEPYGRLLLASPPDTRYPYFYPRDCSSAVALLRRIACSPHHYDGADDAFRLIESTARFARDVCDGSEGAWGQRYSLQKENKSIYKQEDNIAHGMAILCNYLLAAQETGRQVEELDEFLGCINEAAAWSLDHLYQNELNLFHSTTAIHESALEEGFTCWVNFSFLYAFSLAHEVARKIDQRNIIAPSHLDFRRHFLYSVNELFISGERYIRRIDASGKIDLRPDFTLLSPFYYGFLHYRDELQNSAQYIEKHLWDPELGMMMRYLPFHQDFATHVHAGNGPWLQYTAVLAQFQYWIGNTSRGDELVGLIENHQNEKGEIPEHISTCNRFEEFMEREWETGIDFAKEFYKPILLDNLEFDKILEEANNMQRSYRETGEKCMIRSNSHSGGGYIQFATPLMWSHAEYLRALMIKCKDWWKLDCSQQKSS